MSSKLSPEVQPLYPRPAAGSVAPDAPARGLRGRLIVAPVGLAEPTRTCLQSTVLSVLQSEELQGAADRAGLTIQAADANSAREGLQAGKYHMADFTALVRSAIEQARQ